MLRWVSGPRELQTPQETPPVISTVNSSDLISGRDVFLLNWEAGCGLFVLSEWLFVKSKQITLWSNWHLLKSQTDFLNKISHKTRVTLNTVEFGLSVKYQETQKCLMFMWATWEIQTQIWDSRSGILTSKGS